MINRFQGPLTEEEDAFLSKLCNIDAVLSRNKRLHAKQKLPAKPRDTMLPSYVEQRHFLCLNGNRAPYTRKTLMKYRMITGDEAADEGDFSVGDTVKLGYVDQSRDALDDKQTVWQVISDGMEEIELGKRTMQSRAYVGQFNFKGGDQQKTVGQLSGGERNRVHLARMLKSGANLLLLDEPTNDLDVDTLRALEEALLEFAGCAVVVSHDRWFLDRIATHILAFEGDSHVEWFEGNYEAYEVDKKRRLGADADRPTRIKYKPISR